MHEGICDQLYRRRHMWPVSYSTTVDTDFSSNPPTIATSDSFSKDGREIHIGDCALFKPPQDSPPFIGIILKLIVGNKEELRLGVNWLYRPTDVKLAKGNSPLQAAPNEIFYSFHKDETPVASLLHPCKVAFLRKGVELPPRTFSFVCRRVYDIENRCLWWLTDKDYLNERQEEVNYLLDRTKQTMHGAVQPGGRSPRSFKGMVITQPLKQSVDNNNTNNNNNSTSNSTMPLITEPKSKKREFTVEHGSEPIKQERFSKSEDVDSGILRRSESMLKSEIAKITVKGGLVELDCVDKLVNLIKPDSCTDCVEKKIDLVGRAMLVNVIAVTDRFDCLTRFVQLKGLPVLDDWLQEVHKGKNGGGNSPKENEKNVDDFLFALLRALDKLPVNLDALQSCNVGKSVNHLRTHKNSEIQRKARSLVDTWKKRVEAEMNIIDAKSASSRGGVTWPSKSMNSESIPGNKRAGSGIGGGSCESTSKVPVMPPSAISRSPSMKQNNSLEILNNRCSSSASPSSLKPSMHNSKEQTTRGITCGGGADTSLTVVKEDKSSNSSNSQNNSHSCSSEHAKASKEDSKYSNDISGQSNRISGISPRHRKPSNTLSASPTTATQVKENQILQNNCLSIRNPFSAKSSPSRSTPEKLPLDFNNNQAYHRLLVRLPNTVTRSSPFSPTRNDDSSEDPNLFSREVLNNKSRGNAVELGDSNVNVEGSADNNGKADIPIDEHCVVGTEKTKQPAPPTVMEGRSSETAFNSMNSLAESCEKLTDSFKVLIHCTKFSEMGVSVCNGDDIGMNLLATVAAGEISRTENGSPVCSIGGNAPPPEEITSGITSTKSKQLVIDDTHHLKYCVEDHDAVPVKKESSLSLEEQRMQPQPVSSNGDPLNNHAISPVSPSSGLQLQQKTTPVADEYESLHYVADSPPPTKAEISDPGCPSNSHEVKEAAVESPCSSSCKNESEGLKHNLLLPSDNGLQPPQTPPFTRSFSGIDAKIMADVICSEQGKVDSKSDNPASNHFGKADSSSTGSESNKDPIEDSTKQNLIQEHSSPEESSRSKAGEVVDHSNEPTSSSNPTSLLTSGSDAAVKLDFDLNEGFSGEDGYQDEAGIQNLAADSTVFPLPGNQQFHHLPSFFGGFSGSVTVAAAAKGPYFPPENPLKNGVEPGWKGSAATSAFRPAEPRKAAEISLSSPDGPNSLTASPNPSRYPLNIDLNVADERAFEDFFPQKSQVASSESAGQNCGSGGLDLDLNRTDDSLDAINFCGSFSHHQGSSSSKQRFPSVYSNGDFMDSSHSFDLNNGPGPEEGVSREGSQHHHNSRNTSLLPFSLSPPVRISGSDYSTFSPWYPTGNSYSAITIPSILQGRGDQGYPLATISGAVAPPGIQRGLGHAAGNNVSFTPDMYRGTVISSSPAVPFPPPSPSFQYSGFPFEAGSTAYGDAISGGGSGTLCFPAIPPQMMGVIPTHFPRPAYMVGLRGSMNGSSSESRKWGSGILDLNCGPDVERREERCLMQQQQQGVTEEQVRVFQVGVKRKDPPDAGWDPTFPKQQHMSWR